MVDKIVMDPDASVELENDKDKDKAQQASSGVDIKHKNKDGTEINLPAKSDEQDKDPETAKKSGDKPEWVPEKFWDSEKGEARFEEMAKSNAELERALSKQKANKDPDPNPDKQNKDSESKNPIDVARTQYEETGELTEENYKDLETFGLDRGTVDVYLAGVKAQQEAMQAKAYAKAGGTEKTYKEMAEWVSNNLTKAEIDSYNKTLGDPETMEATVEGMYLKFQNAATAEGTQIHGNKSSASTEGYASAQEMMADMNDPRYKTDEAFRKKVGLKIAGAEKRGVNIFS